jgi:hypothetical protein
MKKRMTRPAMTSPGALRRPPVSGVLAFMASWFFFGAGKWLHVNLDVAKDYSAIAAASGRFLTGAIFQLVAAILLAVGVAAVMMALRDAAPKLSAVGGWIAMIGAIGAAGFAQFNLMQLVMADPSLDRAALNDVLNGPLADFGAWGIPIMFVLFAVPVGLFLLALGIARAGIAPSWPAWLIAVYVVIHLGIGSSIISHFLLGGALVWMGLSLLRLDDTVPRTIVLDSADPRTAAPGDAPAVVPQGT